MERLELKIKGLFTSPNDYSSVPQGALLRAKNGVLDSDSLFESRRGQTFYSDAAFADPVTAMFNFDETLLAWADGTLYQDDGSGTFTAFSGTYDKPKPWLQIKSIQQNKNFYFTTAEGVYKLDALTSTPSQAGAPPALDMAGATTGSSGFLQDNTGVAYRMLWGIKDANNNLILGAPSQRFTIEYTGGGSRNVELSFSVPDGITTAWFYQIYRSLPVTAGIEPTDELYLCYEGNPTSGQITAKLVTGVLDQTPDDLLGATLYTSPSQQGIENANLRPPLAADIVTFNNMTFYGNVSSYQRLFLTLIGSGAPGIRFVTTTGDTTTGSAVVTGLATTTNVRVGMRVRGTGVPATAKVLSVDSGSQITMTVNATANGSGVAIQFQDVLTLAGIEWYAASSENIANREFEVFTAGTPAENIEDTALSLVRVINRNTTNTTIYAFYISGYADLPGKLLIESRSLSAATFYATSTAGDSFNPTLPLSGTTVASTNDDSANGVMVSKINQPEAVPIYAKLFVGSANKQLRRIVALRDSILVFKDDGVFRIVGNSFESLVVTAFDPSKRLVAYESPSVFDNQVFCFVEDGVVAASDQGIQLLSKPIENVILPLSQLANFRTNTFGVAYNSDRKYILWTINNENDTYAQTAYIWNAITGTWTTWDLPRVSAIISDATNKLYAANPENDYIYVERKSFTYFDYADEAYPVTIVSVSGKDIELTDASEAVVGYALQQGSRVAIITAINGDVITVNHELLFVPGDATINKPFDVEMQFVPLIGGNPSQVKHFTEATFYFKTANFDQFTAGMHTNNSTEQSFVVPKASNSDGAYGTGFYGSYSYGGLFVTQGRQALRTYVPLSASRGNWLFVSLKTAEPFVNISSLGLSYVFNPMTTKLVAP